MKVCHLTSAHPRKDNRIFYKNCVSLSQWYEVYLIVADGLGDEFDKGIQIIDAGKKRAGRFSRMLFSTYEVYKKAKKVNADIYHFHDPELLPYALKLQKKGKKVIYDVHEDLPKQVLSKHWIPSFLRKTVSGLVTKIEKHAAQKFSGIVTADEAPYLRFQKYQKEKTILTYNYPIKGMFKNTDFAEKNQNSLCYVGGLTKIRGIREMVEAVGSMEVEFHLAGAYSPLSFRDELVNLSGWKKVAEYGFVGPEEVQKIYSKSSIGLVMLHPTEKYKEALPVKMFEYMSAGLVVLASDFPMWKEILKKYECGLTADPLKPEDIREKIKYLLENPQLCREMALNGIKAIETELNWSTQAEKLRHLYAGLKD
ncbi:MAG: glycosyltransferase [Chitinophagaceae bacterium]|nr:MAG: glycosyltransferase [Chitinophagaceae bacterium]